MFIVKSSYKPSERGKRLFKLSYNEVETQNFVPLLILKYLLNNLLQLHIAIAST